MEPDPVDPTAVEEEPSEQTAGEPSEATHDGVEAPLEQSSTPEAALADAPSVPALSPYNPCASGSGRLGVDLTDDANAFERGPATLYVQQFQGGFTEALHLNAPDALGMAPAINAHELAARARAAALDVIHALPAFESADERDEYKQRLVVTMYDLDDDPVPRRVWRGHPAHRINSVKVEQAEEVSDEEGSSVLDEVQSRRLVYSLDH